MRVSFRLALWQGHERSACFCSRLFADLSVQAHSPGCSVSTWGGTDLIARALGEALAKDLGQTIVVDNKPRAGTVIGNHDVAKSLADGHTVLLNTSAIAIVPSLVPKLPYAADSAFAPITVLGRAPNVAVVRADSPLKSAKDFLAQAKAQAGKLNYGSAGNGTSTHLAAELLKMSAKISITHVPYRGASPRQELAARFASISEG